MGARLGIEAIGRTSDILFSWVIFVFIVLIILLFPDMEIKKILPVYEGGIKPVKAFSLEHL